MRKRIKYLFLCIVTIGLLVGCTNSSKEQNVESFIRKLVSYDTYKDISSLEESGRFIEDCKSIFGEYITDEYLLDIAVLYQKQVLLQILILQKLVKQKMMDIFILSMRFHIN